MSIEDLYDQQQQSDYSITTKRSIYELGDEGMTHFRQYKNTSSSIMTQYSRRDTDYDIFYNENNSNSHGDPVPFIESHSNQPPLVVTWSSIKEEFDYRFNSIYLNTTSKIHLDFDVYVIDGSKAAWKDLVLLDCILCVLIGKQPNRKGGSRRKFNQYVALRESVCVVCSKAWVDQLTRHHNDTESLNLKSTCSMRFPTHVQLDDINQVWSSIDDYRNESIETCPKKSVIKRSEILDTFFSLEIFRSQSLGDVLTYVVNIIFREVNLKFVYIIIKLLHLDLFNLIDSTLYLIYSCMYEYTYICLFFSQHYHSSMYSPDEVTSEMLLYNFSPTSSKSCLISSTKKRKTADKNNTAMKTSSSSTITDTGSNSNEHTNAFITSKTANATVATSAVIPVSTSGVIDEIKFNKKCQDILLFATESVLPFTNIKVT